MKPQHNSGEYVFCVVNDLKNIKLEEVILVSKEQGTELIKKKELADRLKLPYSFICVLDYLDSPFFLRGSRIHSSFSMHSAKRN
jgi:hypothetical protein